MFGNKIKQKLNFRIKLLSGNSVALVERSGFDSEIFIPVIINGRITFQNVIPKRRCCYGVSTKGVRELNVVANREAPGKSCENSTYPLSCDEESGEYIRTHCLPVACSTPAPAKQQANNDNIRNDSEYGKNGSSAQSSPELPIPEAVRKVIPSRQVTKNTNRRLPGDPKVIKYIREDRRKVSRHVDSLISAKARAVAERTPLQTTPRTDDDEPADTSGFCLPSTPTLSHSNINNHKSSAKEVSEQLRTSSHDSSVKWRKCITPLRTYSRRTNVIGQTQPNHKHPGRVKPTYLVNMTQGTKPTHKWEQRKIVIDSKTIISPRTFKTQQTEKQELKNKYFHVDLPPKPSKASTLTAFDLLTNSNQARSMSQQLNHQFRKACVNRISSTNPKYNVLCSVPPLERDGQIRDRPRKLLKKKVRQNLYHNFKDKPQNRAS